MSSLPNQTHLTPNRRHKHKRSAAVSGDFDAMGLGLFAPKHTYSSSNPGPGSYDSTDYDYNFDNFDDFANKPVLDDFAFPRGSVFKGDDLKNEDFKTDDDDFKYSSPRAIIMSPRKSLHSPIKIRSSHEVIDLDEILNANLHIGYSGDGTNNSTGSLQADYDDEFLALPFIKHTSPFISSPSNNYSFNSAPTASFLLNQPIQEQTDLMEEEEEATPSNELYTNLSANSSCSSIRSTAKTPLIEKTFSNSSRDSASSLHAPYNNAPYISPLMTSVIPSGKRLGAKANRYQTFYDQSSRISNAMKISSSDSVNIIRSNSSGTNIVPVPSTKDRSLGHSSSLPSLKSNSQKRIISFQHRQRLAHGMEYKRVASPPMRSLSQEKFHSSTSLNSLNSKEIESNSLDINTSHNSLEIQNTSQNSIEIHSSHEIHNTSVISNEDDDLTAHTILDTPSITLTPTTSAMKSIKVSSTSPISLHSDVSSAVISSNDTVQSTDHSSLASQHDSIIGKSRKQANERIHDILAKSETSTPAITIGCYDGTSSPSTNSTFRQDDDDQKSQIFNESTLVSAQGQEVTMSEIISPIPLHANILSGNSSGKSSIKSPKRSSPRRKMTPAEEKILKLTTIPTFKMSSVSPVGTSSLSSSLVGSPVLSSSPGLGSPTTISFPRPNSKTKFGGSPEPDNSEAAVSSPTFFGKKALKLPQDNPAFVLSPPESKERRSSTFTLLERESKSTHQRRGSTFSIASLPVNMAPSKLPTNSMANSRNVRHSKTKSFSLSMHDLTPRFSRLGHERDPDKKTTKFISWFRKK